MLPRQPMPMGSWAASETHATCAASCLFTMQVNLKRKHWDARGPQQRMQQLFKKQLAEAGHRATQQTHVPSLQQQHQERLQAKERDNTRSEVGHCPSCGCPLLLAVDPTLALLTSHCLYKLSARSADPDGKTCHACPLQVIQQYRQKRRKPGLKADMQSLQALVRHGQAQAAQ